MPVVATKLPYPEFSGSGYHVIKTPYFSIKTRPNGLLVNRIGVVIGVRAMKKAVDRNFWKRQMRVGLKDLKQGGNDILVVFSRKPLRSEKKEIKEALLCRISIK